MGLSVHHYLVNVELPHFVECHQALLCFVLHRLGFVLDLPNVGDFDSVAEPHQLGEQPAPEGTAPSSRSALLAVVVGAEPVVTLEHFERSTRRDWMLTIMTRKVGPATPASNFPTPELVEAHELYSVEQPVAIFSSP